MTAICYDKVVILTDTSQFSALGDKNLLCQIGQSKQDKKYKLVNIVIVAMPNKFLANQKTTFYKI